MKKLLILFALLACTSPLVNAVRHSKNKQEEGSTIAGVCYLFLSACSGFVAYESYKSTQGEPSLMARTILEIHQAYKQVAGKSNRITRLLKDSDECKTIGYGLTGLFGSISLAFGINGIKNLIK